MPYTAVLVRVLGNSSLRSIAARISDTAPMDVAASALTRLLITRHGQKDFFLFNTEFIRQAVKASTATLTVMIASIAVVSLVVGGIGVMNIMLVSVSERTREIGIRMAVGARRSDILHQFLIEAVLVCAIGGVLGVALALVAEFTYSHISTRFPMIFSPFSVVTALAVSTIIGVASGYLPARQAAQLDPIKGLASE
jgi:macrolide transport system ATP-binding/permease protein